MQYFQVLLHRFPNWRSELAGVDATVKHAAVARNTADADETAVTTRDSGQLHGIGDKLAVHRNGHDEADTVTSNGHTHDSCVDAGRSLLGQRSGNHAQKQNKQRHNGHLHADTSELACAATSTEAQKDAPQPSNTADSAAPLSTAASSPGDDDVTGSHAATLATADVNVAETADTPVSKRQGCHRSVRLALHFALMACLGLTILWALHWGLTERGGVSSLGLSLGLGTIERSAAPSVRLYVITVHVLQNLVAYSVPECLSSHLSATIAHQRFCRLLIGHASHIDCAPDLMSHVIPLSITVTEDLCVTWSYLMPHVDDVIHCFKQRVWAVAGDGLDSLDLGRGACAVQLHEGCATNTVAAQRSISEPESELCGGLQRVLCHHVSAPCPRVLGCAERAHCAHHRAAHHLRRALPGACVCV